MVVSDGNDLLDELEFRRGRTVRDKLLFPERAVRAASIRKTNFDEEEGDFSASSFSRGRSVSRAAVDRSARATSVYPATLRHFNDVNEVAAEHDYYDPGYSNEGLHRARRALSEARVIASDLASSREREMCSYESTEKSRMKSSSLLASQNQSASAESGQYGSYKIVVTPKVESWDGYVLPRRRSWSSRSVTNALLAKYNPTQFPDFIFGTYGPGQRLNEPISSSLKYHTRSILDDDIASSLDTSRLSKRQAIRDLDISSDYYKGSSAYENEDSSNYYKSAQSSRVGKYDKASRLAEDSSSMSYYDAMARNYGIKMDSNYSAGRERESTARTASTPAPDPVARAYFEKYGSNLEEKSSKYFNEEDADFGQSFSNAQRRGSASAYGQGINARARAQSEFEGGAAGYAAGQGNNRAGSVGPKSFRLGNKYYDYNTDSRVSKISPLSKFYHYYIPKHYEATPMLGGYMVPAGTREGKYGWKY